MIKIRGKEMNFSDLTIDEIIKRYQIVIPDRYPDKICMVDFETVKRDNTLEDIKKAKPQIFSRLKEIEEQKRIAAEERKAKIKAIPGLDEIKTAIYERDKWQYEWEKSFDDAGGIGVGQKPHYDFKAAYEKYPRATAYLKAEAMSQRSDPTMFCEGEKAMERIINGEDSETVIEEMERKIKKSVEEHFAFFD